MYKCKKCENPLTEYDVTFYKELFPNKKLEDYECAKHYLNQDSKELLQKRSELTKLMWICLMPILISVLAVITLLESFELRVLSIPLLAVAYILIIVSAIIYCVQNKDSFDSDLTVVGSHYESSVGSDGKITTREVKDYAGDYGGLVYILGSVFMPPIFLFFLLGDTLSQISKNNKKIKEEILPEIVDAYKKANKEVPVYRIAKQDVKEYEAKLTKHNEKVTKIKKKYEVLGENKVNDMVSRFLIENPEPLLIANIFKQKYIVIERNKNYAFLLYYDNEGKEKGIVIDLGQNSKIYFSTNDWRQEWSKLGLSADGKARLTKCRQSLSK